MVNYGNGKIYKIESITGEGLPYIGSTTKQYLSQRMQGHRDGYYRWKAGKAQQCRSYKLFDEYGMENCVITLIELFECNSKDELRAREGYHQRLMECVNCRIEKRTKQEKKRTVPKKETFKTKLK